MTEENVDNNIPRKGKVYFTDNENLYLPAIAKKCGYEFCVNSSKSIPEVLNDILENKPDYIVANVTFPRFRQRLEILSRIKELIPSAKIIVTGEPFLTYNNNVTYENPFIDYVIIGEPEETLQELLEGYISNEILGICYTDDNMQTAKTEQRPFIENLDNLPFPERDYLTDKSLIEIEVSRGCPYNCFFCMSTVSNGVAHRVRTPQNIVSEIKYCIENFCTKKFFFKSDIFNFNNEWVENLCNEIISAGLKINWSCELLPKNIDEKLIRLMYKSGLRYCKVGVESGAEEILKKLDKDINIDEIKKTVSILKKNKIKITCFYVFGLPWETEETARKTIDFALSLHSEEAVFNIAVPIPGTKFFVYSMLNKLFSVPPEFSEGERLPLCKTHKLSRERILQIKKEAERKFYSRPKYVLKQFFEKYFLNR